MRQKGSGVHVPSCPIMHAFIRSPTNSQASSTGKQNRPLSLFLCTSLPSVHGCRLRHWKKKTTIISEREKKPNTPNCPACVRARVHMYVLESLPSLPLCSRLHSTSFISTIKISVLKNMSTEHVNTNTPRMKTNTFAVIYLQAYF